MAGMRGLHAYFFRAFGFSKQASSRGWSVVDGDLWTGGFYRAALRFISDGYAHFHRWFDKELTGNHAYLGVVLREQFIPAGVRGGVGCLGIPHVDRGAAIVEAGSARLIPTTG